SSGRLVTMMVSAPSPPSCASRSSISGRPSTRTKDLSVPMRELWPPARMATVSGSGMPRIIMPAVLLLLANGVSANDVEAESEAQPYPARLRPGGAPVRPAHLPRAVLQALRPRAVGYAGQARQCRYDAARTVLRSG